MKFPNCLTCPMNMELVIQAAINCTKINVRNVTVELLEMSMSSALNILKESSRALSTVDAKTCILYILSDYFHNMDTTAIKELETENHELVIGLFQEACTAGALTSQLIELIGIWRKRRLISENLLKKLPLNENVDFLVERLIERRSTFVVSGDTGANDRSIDISGNQLQTDIHQEHDKTTDSGSFLAPELDESAKIQSEANSTKLSSALEEFYRGLEWKGPNFHELDEPSNEPFTYEGWTPAFIESHVQLDPFKAENPQHVVLSDKQGYHAVPPPVEY